MSYIDIHGKKVHLDENSSSAHHYAEYLLKNPDHAKAFFDEAHRNRTHGDYNGVAHFKIPDNASNIGVTHHASLVDNGDGTYTLRKRHGH